VIVEFRIAMSIDLLPLFPLPSVVLFPNVFLPLHIFEPRYRTMVGDALAGDRMIGMVLLQPGWEANYEGRPRVYPVGCSGVITHVETLVDGRYNIVLRGLERFRILNEDDTRSYRLATVAPLAETPLGPDDRSAVRQHRARLEALLAPAIEQAGLFKETSSSGLGAAASMPDEDLINALAQYLDLEPVEKQALLEQDGLRRRVESLVELLEMKLLTARLPAPSNISH
jgi:Lon protease-like protein